VLVLDYLNARQVRESLVPQDEAIHKGLRVDSRRTLEGSRVVKHMTLTHLDTGAQRQVMESVRLYEPLELRTMAAQSGLAIGFEAGDYQGAPFDSSSSARWIGFLTPEPGSTLTSSQANRERSS
jgi:hypothetical protein